MSKTILFVFSASIIAILYSFILSRRISKKDAGDEKIKDIAGAIHKGAMTFLNKEYKVLSIFVIIIAFLLSVFMNNWMTGFAFILGSFLSALAGNIGMRIATKANSRTAVACKKDINSGLKIAFDSGSVMGLSVVGFGLMGILIIFLISGGIINYTSSNILYSFGFGASLVALFARVGGGIYTKAADIGADLVGKIEEGIPEDDPRNPATIADNVGDNVGDVAGMGADLYESYVQSIISTMIIGAVLIKTDISITLPLILSACGIFAAIIGGFFVKTKNEKKYILH